MIPGLIMPRKSSRRHNKPLASGALKVVPELHAAVIVDQLVEALYLFIMHTAKAAERGDSAAIARMERIQQEAARRRKEGS